MGHPPSTTAKIIADGMDCPEAFPKTQIALAEMMRVMNDRGVYLVTSLEQMVVVALDVLEPYEAGDRGRARDHGGL